MLEDRGTECYPAPWLSDFYRSDCLWQAFSQSRICCSAFKNTYTMFMASILTNHGAAAVEHFKNIDFLEILGGWLVNSKEAWKALTQMSWQRVKIWTEKSQSLSTNSFCWRHFEELNKRHHSQKSLMLPSQSINQRERGIGKSWTKRDLLSISANHQMSTFDRAYVYPSSKVFAGKKQPICSWDQVYASFDFSKYSLSFARCSF